jgi:hypothetical protein
MSNDYSLSIFLGQGIRVTYGGDYYKQNLRKFKLQHKRAVVKSLFPATFWEDRTEA